MTRESGDPIELAAYSLRLERPREVLDRLRQADPLDVRTYLLRGTALNLLGRSHDAERELGRGLELEPESVPLLWALANAQMVSDAFGAEVTLRKALALEPQNASLFETYVFILMEQGRYEWAEKMLLRGNAIDPEAMQRVRTVFLIRAASSDGALRAAQELLRNDPDGAAAHYLHGLALLNKGRPAQGIRHLREAAALRPADPMFASAARTLGAWYLWPVYLTVAPVHQILAATVFVVGIVFTIFTEDIGVFWTAFWPFVAFTAYKWIAVGISALLMKWRVTAAMRD